MRDQLAFLKEGPEMHAKLSRDMEKLRSEVVRPNTQPADLFAGTIDVHKVSKEQHRRLATRVNRLFAEYRKIQDLFKESITQGDMPKYQNTVGLMRDWSGQAVAELRHYFPGVEIVEVDDGDK